MIDSLTAGGAEALTLAFARAVDPDRLRPTVVCLKSLGGNPYEEALRETDVPVIRLDARNLRDLRAFRRLTALLDETGAELIHAHLESASIWGTLAGRLRRRPVVTTFHTAPGPVPAAVGPQGESERRPRGWTREDVRRRLRLALVNRWARRNLMVSEAALRGWAAAGLDPRRATVVHNGIDCAPFERAADEPELRAGVRAELGGGDGEPLVVSVSVLRPGKGLETLVEAAPRVLARVPGARFAIAGEGPLAEGLRHRAETLGVADAFRWLGFRRDVAAVLAAADLFVLPSRNDAFPTALLEAMAAGLPAVAGDAGGIPEIVEAGRTGILVPPGDPGRLADAVADLLERPAERTAMGRCARERVRSHFSVGAWLGRLDVVYREAIGGEGEA